MRRNLGDGDVATRAKTTAAAAVKAFPWMQVLGSLVANVATFMVIRSMLERAEKAGRKKRKHYGGFDGI